LRYHERVPGFYIENFGCRASQADGAAIARQLADRGYDSSEPDQAQVVVLNTCTVTADADRSARAAVRRIHAANPAAQILLTGCYAQRAPSELAALPGVSWVVGNSHKSEIADIVRPSDARSSSIHAPIAPFVPLRSLLETQSDPIRPTSVYVGDIFAHTGPMAAPFFGQEASGRGDFRTRPNLKVQDGCDNRCSFCIIPSVRGRSRSSPLDRVLRDINALAASGCQEVVISGINLGRWGRDLNPTSRFEGLVETILERTSIPKLRLSSIEPMDWSNRLIRLVSLSPRIAKHAHVPLQSGSDSVLRRMRRKYRPWHYREKVSRIREAMPTAAIGADVMTGFPGETDAEFDETRRMVEELPLTYLHIFPYSARPGTPAAELPEQVPIHVARQRHHVLRDLIAEKKRAFACSFEGQVLDSITLHSSGVDFTNALTDNFLEVHVAGRYEPNQWLSIRIESNGDGVLYGSPA